MDKPFHSHFGDLGQGTHTEKALAEEYTPPHMVSEQTKKFI